MKPIIFDAESVNAILRGCKTQTRRILRQQPERQGDRMVWCPPHAKYDAAADSWVPICVWNPERKVMDTGAAGITNFCPYGRHGDRLWVRENWRPKTWSADGGWGEIEYADGVVRHVEGNCSFVRMFPAHFPPDRWRSSARMFRWASRITLEIVAVRVERLQDITEADAVAEGTKCLPGRTVGNSWCERECFAHRWDHINGKRAPWESSPFVWVIEFRRVEHVDRT